MKILLASQIFNLLNAKICGIIKLRQRHRYETTYFSSRHGGSKMRKIRNSDKRAYINIECKFRNPITGKILQIAEKVPASDFLSKVEKTHDRKRRKRNNFKPI